MNTFNVDSARTLASYWHGGQASPMYAFASSGTVIVGLAGEARECAYLATGDDEHDRLMRLCEWAEEQEEAAAHA